MQYFTAVCSDDYYRIRQTTFYQLTVHNVVVAGIKKNIFHYFSASIT